MGTDYKLMTYHKEIVHYLHVNGGCTNVQGSEQFRTARNNFYRTMCTLEEKGLVERLPSGDRANCDYVWFLTEDGVGVACSLDLESVVTDT